MVWFSNNDINIDHIIELDNLHGYILPHAGTKYTGNIISETLRFKPEKYFDTIIILYFPINNRPNVYNKYHHEYYVPYKSMNYVINNIWFINHDINYIDIDVRNINNNNNIGYIKDILDTSLIIVSADFSHFLPLQKAIQLENKAAHALMHRYIYNNEVFLDVVDHIKCFIILYKIIPYYWYMQWIGRTRSPGEKGVGYLSFLIREEKQQNYYNSPNGLFVTAYDKNMQQRECLGIWYSDNIWSKESENNKIKEVINKAKTTSRLTNGKYLNIPVTHYTITYLYIDNQINYPIRGWHGILSNAFYLPDVLLENTYDNGKWIKSTDIIWEQGNLFNINDTLDKLSKKANTNKKADIKLYYTDVKHRSL